MGDALHGGWARVADWLAFEIRLGELVLGLGALLGALLTLLLIWLFASLVKRAINRYAISRDSAHRAGLYTVSRVAYYLLIVLAVTMALSVAGIPLTRFAVFAGAVGIGLGLGLQAIFNNFVSGLILLFDRSLKVGDFVELESGVHGEVKDINIRATLIRTNDNVDILVPNSEFVSGRVTNWTHHDLSRRMRIPFGVAYGSDKELVKKAALETASEVAFTLTLEGERGPKVWLVGFGDSSIRVRAGGLADRGSDQAPFRGARRLLLGAGKRAVQVRHRHSVPATRPAHRFCLRSRARGRGARLGTRATAARAGAAGAGAAAGARTRAACEQRCATGGRAADRARAGRGRSAGGRRARRRQQGGVEGMIRGRGMADGTPSGG